MKKISLKVLSEILSEKELRSVVAGSGMDTSGYCYEIKCSDGKKETCNDTFDSCITYFSFMCPYGGFFYPCEK